MGTLESVKINDNEIEITKQADAPASVKTKYDYDFLLNQRAQIIKQANDYMDQRQAELDEVNELILECDKLGVTAKKMPGSIPLPI